MIILFGIMGFGLLIIAFRCESREDRTTGFIASGLVLAAFSLAVYNYDWRLDGVPFFNPSYTADR